MLRSCLALLLGCSLIVNPVVHAAASVAKSGGRLFQFKDWEVACDNVRRCQAAGYQQEGGMEGVVPEPAAVLLTREAGPGATIDIRFIVPDPDNPQPPRSGPWTVHIGETRLQGVVSEQALPAKSVQSLMVWLSKGDNIRVSRGQDVRHISLSGSHAALLKMDDVQGRVGTPGAFLRKGDKPESAALPPLPAPELRAKPLMAATRADTTLIKPILAAVKKRGCWDDVAKDADADPGIIRVSATEVMVTRLCWQAAYQSGRAAWLASSTAPHNPVPVVFPGVDGLDLESPSELNLNPDGTAFSAMKGRGIGDCWETHEWAWTGQYFELAKSQASGMCRQIPGGVSLRLWTTKKP